MVYKHWSNTPIVELYDVREQMTVFKPQGLWLSYEDEWIEWCKEHGFSMGTKYEYEVILTKEHGLYEITSLDDLKRLNNVYTSWDAVAKVYNGVLVKNYQKIRHQVLLGIDWVSKNDQLGYMWFLGLDINCACIWRPSRAICQAISLV